MAGPVLTPDEIQQMQKESVKATEAAATFQAAVAGQQARAAELAKVDSAFKKFFDYYNNIVVAYDIERKLQDGNYIVNPITEADILSVGNLQGGRLQPSLPATDVVRVAEFDGGPLVVDPMNESQFITDQAGIENTLVNGYGGASPPSSVLTNSSISPGSTTLQLTDLLSTFSIAPGSVFIVSSGGDLAVVKILTFVMQSSPVPPPFVADCTIELIVPPTGTIASGQNLIAFSGFSNGERTTKTASDPQLQSLMNYLVLQLQTKINQRITSLNGQLVQLGLNLDPDGVAAIAQATTNVNSSRSILTNYLVSTNISNSGLGTLSAERGIRTTDISTRVAQIISAYTGQTLNYYDQRYTFANNRGSTSRGSLRLQKNAEQVSQTSQEFATTLQAQAQAINSVLP